MALEKRQEGDREEEKERETEGDREEETEGDREEEGGVIVISLYHYLSIFVSLSIPH